MLILGLDIVFPYVSRIAPPSPAPSSAPAASPSVGEFAGIPRHDHYFLEQGKGLHVDLYCVLKFMSSVLRCV